jgi:MFS family permease
MLPGFPQPILLQQHVIPLIDFLIRTAFLLISGSLSDIFGRKIFFIMTSCLGILSSILGATAKTTNQIIANNAVMGVATAFSSGEFPFLFYRMLTRPQCRLLHFLK